MTQALAHAQPQAQKSPPRRVSQPHDHDEREARRAAEVVAGGGSVAGWSFSALPVSAARPDTDEAHARTCGCGGTCPECRRARLQRSSRSPAPAPQVDGGVVDAAVRTRGEPLRAGTRSFFEERFGADLADVRVHADAEAATSADALDAHAYALGRHLVFGPGEYRPDSAAGRRLLAHELAHVLQQERTGARIQRDEKEKKTPVDVALVLDNDAQSVPAAQALAPNVVRVVDASDMKAALTKLGRPIGTLFVVSHASSEGKLKFETKSGIITWKTLNEISTELKGALPADKAPQVVDFRGCKLGEATEELGRFREAVGAGAVKASNCWSFDNVVGPVSIGGVPITSEGQLDSENTKTFDKGLGMLVNTLKSEDGTSVKNCVLGLAPGETPAKNMAKVRSQYFRAGGTITAEWASPAYDKTWQAGSKCFKDLTESTTPCKLTVKTPPKPEEEQPKKKAALEGPDPGTGVEAEAAAPEPVPEEAPA